MAEEIRIPKNVAAERAQVLTILNQAIIPNREYKHKLDLAVRGYYDLLEAAAKDNQNFIRTFKVESNSTFKTIIKISWFIWQHRKEIKGILKIVFRKG